MESERTAQNKESQNNEEELELIRRYLDNDEEAQRILIDQYKTLIWYIIYHEIDLSRIAGIDVDDLYQEGLIALHKAITTYQSYKDIPLLGLAGVCIRRRMKSYIKNQNRKNRQFKTISLDWRVEENERYWVYEMIPSQKTEQKKVDYIPGLRPMEQKILTLRINGFKYKEIAQKLGINKKAVDNTMQRIRRKLRNRGFTSKDIVD